jgi:hypothetical protein
MKKENHIEVSDGGTILIASETCPLTEKEIQEAQCFSDTVCCMIQGQPPHPAFTCPKFYAVIYGNKGFKIDCRGA